MAIQFVEQHHSVHSSERVVAGEEISAVRVEFFDTYRPVSDVQVLQGGSDEFHRRQMGVTVQDSVYFVLMNDSFEVGDHETGQHAC